MVYISSASMVTMNLEMLIIFRVFRSVDPVLYGELIECKG